MSIDQYQPTPKQPANKQLQILVGYFAAHADTLAENKATIDFAALGITDKATGLALPLFGTKDITMVEA